MKLQLKRRGLTIHAETATDLAYLRSLGLKKPGARYTLLLDIFADPDAYDHGHDASGVCLTFKEDRDIPPCEDFEL